MVSNGKIRSGLKKAKFFGIIFVFTFSFLSYFSNTAAAFNEQINYQGKLTNSSNVSVPDGGYNLRFSLCDNVDCSGGSNPLWTETYCYGGSCDGTGTDERVQTSGGLFSVLLGSVNSLSSVDFNSSSLYLQVEVGGSAAAPAPGDWQTLSPAKRLGTVPSAMEAKYLGGRSSTEFAVKSQSETITGGWTFENNLAVNANSLSPALAINQSSTDPGAYAAVFTGGNVGIGTTAPTAKLDVAGDVNISGTSTLATTTMAFESKIGTSDKYFTVKPYNFGGGSSARTIPLVSFNSGDFDGGPNIGAIEDTLYILESTGNPSLSFVSANVFGGGGIASISYVTSSNAFVMNGASTYYFDNSVYLTSGNLTSANNIIALGYVSGTWSGAIIGLDKGGTGTSTLPAFGQLLMGNATNDGYDLIGTSSLGLGNVFGAGSAGQLSYWDGNNSITATDSLYWDNLNGYLGIGTTVPTEKLAVAGAINLGNTAGTTAGTIRWTGTDFEGYNGAEWKSFTGGGPGGAVNGSGTSTQIAFWSAADAITSTDTLYWDSTNARLGVGLSAPLATVHVQNSAEQLRLGYDGTYYTSFTVGADGSLAITNNPTYLYPTTTLNGGLVVNANATGNNLVVDNTNGYVGIGTSSPSALFSIKGGFTPILNFANSSDATLLFMDYLGNVGVGTSSPASTFFVQGNASYPIFNVVNQAGTSSLYVNIAGNVGIGTSNPAAMLHVYQTTEQLRLGYDDTRYVGFTVNDGGALTIATTPAASTTFTNDVVVNTKIGINSSTPGALFAVKGGYSDPILNVTNYSDASLLFMDTTGNVGIGTSSPVSTFFVQGNASYPIFNVTDQYGITSSLYVSTAGNVGIGTNAPGAMLHVYSPTDQLRLGYDASNYSSFAVGADGALTITPSASSYATTTINSGLVVNANWTGNNFVVDKATGNVGIGTNAPGYALDVNGYVNATKLCIAGNCYSSFDVNVGGSGAANYLPYWTDGTTLGVDYNLYRDGVNFNFGSYKVGIGATAVNTFDVYGNMAIGTYAGANAAPANGLLVEGNVGIGTTAAANNLNVYGRVTIGTTYASTNAPTNGLLVSGNVSIGTSAASAYKLEVSGAAAGVLSLARLRNTQAAGVTNVAQMFFSTNRTTGGLTEAAAIGGMLTDITNAAYKGALLFKTADNAAPAERARLDNVGRFGLGTTNPSYLLDVYIASSTADLFRIATSTNSGIFVVRSTGNVGIGTTTMGYMLSIDTGSTSTVAVGVNGSIKASGFITGTTTVDLAETYPISRTCGSAGDCPVSADLVCANEDEYNFYVEKCSASSSVKIIGIVSANPGFVLGGPDVSSSGTEIIGTVKIALAGRVPVRVSTAGGAIKAGDYLTYSSEPGVAIKAANPGPVVGSSLNSFGEPALYNQGIIEQGEVTVFINPHWNIGEFTEEGVFADVTTTYHSGFLDQFTLAVANSLRKLGLFIKDGIARVSSLFAGEVTTDRLCVGGTCVTESQLKDLLQKNGTLPDIQTAGVGSSSTPSSTVTVTLTEEGIAVSSSTPGTDTSTPPAETAPPLAQEPPPAESPPAPAEPPPAEPLATP